MSETNQNFNETDYLKNNLKMQGESDTQEVWSFKPPVLSRGITTPGNSAELYGHAAGTLIKRGTLTIIPIMGGGLADGAVFLINKAPPIAK